MAAPAQVITKKSTLREIWRKIVWIVLIGLLAYTCFEGFAGGIPDWKRSHGTGEKAVAALNVLYGIAAVVALLMILFRTRWIFLSTLIWAVFCEACGVLAVIVYSESSVWL